MSKRHDEMVAREGRPAARGFARGAGSAKEIRTVKPSILGFFSIFLSAAALSGTTGAASAAALAEDGFHPRVAERLAELDRARGPEVYTAITRLRRVASLTDPAVVQAALEQFSADRRHPAPERSYAASALAQLRSTRGDDAGAARGLEAQAFVDRWLFIGPFDNEGGSGFGKVFGPEVDAATPILAGRAYDGKDRPVRWRALSDVFPLSRWEFDALVDAPRNSCSYMTTFVSAKAGTRADRPISLWIGAGGAFRVFWNGAEVFEETAYRGLHRDRHALGVKLAEGQNNLTIKVCTKEQPGGLVVRLGRPDGSPDTELTTSGDFATSALATKNATKKSSTGNQETSVAAARAKTVRVRPGPFARFAERAGRKNAKARDIYAFAEFLRETDADDPLQHQARNLAQKAAEKEPRVEYLLLASRLAEDRNHRAEWVAKAALAAKASKKMGADVLIAQARLAEQSQNWREALPYYQQAHALEPDNLEALEGRVRFYSSAGLERTALKLVADAVERHPRSYQLLNLYARRLAALGRESEAIAAEGRASALLGNASQIAGKIDLAISRRDRADAMYWIDRLLGTAGPAWSFHRAAQGYRALGNPELAVATYERRLALAPENTATMNHLANLHAEDGNRNEQVGLLEQVLELQPQSEQVREYLAHMQPAEPRADEAYAWESDAFLELAKAPVTGFTERVLVDLNVTTVYDSGLSSQFRQIVFQPLTDVGAANGRQYAFSFEAGRQRVKLRGARVYRADGRIDEAIESGQGAANDPSIAMYTSGRTYYVRFPRLEPNDVVELRYRVDDVARQNDFGDYFGDLVQLQSPVPTAHAEYVISVPKTRKLKTEIVGLPSAKQTVTEKDNQRIYRFVADDIPAIVPEPAMPPWREILGHVHVSTYENWKDLGVWYWGLAKDQFDLDDDTRKIAHDISADAKTDLDKVKAVYGWVTKNTRYVALEFGIYGYKPRRCVQTVARGWGDCKDKATVIVTMLEELGVDATIVALRTRRNGEFNSKLASLAPFDHAIAYVPSLDLFLDGTAEHTGALELPAGDLGAMGLLINEGASKLVRLPGVDPTRDVYSRAIHAELTAEGSAMLTVETNVKGSVAPYWRSRYHAEGTRRDRVERDIGSEFPGFHLSEGERNLKTADFENIEEEVEFKATGTVPQFARIEGEQLSVPVTTEFGLTNRYASLSKRKLDVWLPVLGTQTETFEITIPGSLSIASAPTDTEIKTPFGTYSLKVERQDGKIITRATLSIAVERIEPKDYAAWRAFCLKVDEAQRTRLALTRGGRS